jgi:Domain of unknown function (DUF1906)
MLNGNVKKATTGLLGFDANTIISLDLAKQFYSQGYRFCLRYISRSPEPAYDLNPTEAEDILNGGLALMPVQHVRAGTWVATADLGTGDGTMAWKNAYYVGFPTGVNIWCDLEAVDLSTPVADVIAYCNNWANAVNSAGYLSGLYVGYQDILTSPQLASLNFKSFWRSQSNVPNVGGIGFQMIQLYAETAINGIKVDFDVTQSDFKNGEVSWLVRDNLLNKNTLSPVRQVNE